MNSITKILTISTLLTVATAGVATQSASFGSDIQGIYVGVDGGYGTYNCSDCATTGTGYPLPYTTGSTSNSDTTVTLFGGYQLNQYVAIELGLGKLPSSKISFTDPQDPTQNMKFTYEMNHYYAAIKGMVPLKNQFGLFGKVGYDTIFTDSNDSNSSVGALLLAAGATYNLTHNLAVLAAYNQIFGFDSSNAKIGYAALGLTYLF